MLSYFALLHKSLLIGILFLISCYMLDCSFVTGHLV